VLGVLQVCSNELDYEYLVHTARKKKLTDLMNKALNTAGIFKNDQ
jgi:hypothetical protein